MADYREKRYRAKCVSCAYLSGAHLEGNLIDKEVTKSLRNHTIAGEFRRKNIEEASIWDFIIFECHKRRLNDLFRSFSKDKKLLADIARELTEAKCPRLGIRGYKSYQPGITPSEALSRENRNRTTALIITAIVITVIGIVLALTQC